jgi:hypothetical protein
MEEVEELFPGLRPFWTLLSRRYPGPETKLEKDPL